MGKLRSFTIDISNAGGVCQPGERLHGFVCIDLESAMKMKGIIVRIKGECRVCFKLPDGDGETAFNGREPYFEEYITLHEPAAEEKEVSLEAGSHKFYFQYDLPHSLPSSFESEFGTVRYSVLCRIQKPWKSDYMIKELFSIVNSLDLNMEKTAEEPYKDEVSRADACCFCYDNGDVTLSLDLPRSGYVPGETIHVTSEINNRTSGFVRNSVHLIQKAIYTSPETDRKKVAKEIVNEIADLELGPHSKYVLNREKLRVPSVPPSRLDGCSLITLSYYLKVKACTDFSGVCCKSIADLIIGTVPLKSTFRKSRAGLEEGEDQSVPLAQEEEVPVKRIASLDYPMPAYQDCVFGDVLMDCDEDPGQTHCGVVGYAPKYPVYEC